MGLDIHGTVTRRSNGSIDITPADGAPASRIVVHESALGSKQLPSMGDEVTITIAVTAPVTTTERTAAPDEASETAHWPQS